MIFNTAIEIVASALSKTGTDIDTADYDGIIVKRLEASNTLDDGRTTKQTHIAITGSQMDIFPYLRSDGYFNDATTDADLKKYYIIQIPVVLHKSNVEYLDDSQTEIHFDSEIKSSYTSVVRSKRKSQADQIQVSLINFDAPDFVAFRKLLHSGHYLVILKIKQRFKYEAYGLVPNKKIESDGGLQELNNQFLKLATNTTVDISSLLGISDVSNNIKLDRLKIGTNILYYGVPGCGKSYAVKQYKNNHKIDNAYTRRVVFHPDYTYSDFVGQIIPHLQEEGNTDTLSASGKPEKRLVYDFVPGPFTEILKIAIANPAQECLLIIEELNRGNAPAIFGELFQLLDRDEDGNSTYAINNNDIAKIVYANDDDKNMKTISIPSNLTILATMNTSDQNVFSMDTAFQRRWRMKHIKNVFEGEQAEKEVPNADNLTWKAFAETINDILSKDNNGFGSTEDKSLGVYFATSADFDNAENFGEKVLKYLWDDAFKLRRKDLFKEIYRNLYSVLDAYEDKGLKAVLKDDVYKKMQDKQKELSQNSATDDTIANNPTAETAE